MPMPSAVIRSFRYDDDQQTLTIEFVSGKSYLYRNVSRGLYEAFRAYREKGVFYNQHIRGSYPFIKLDTMSDNKQNIGKQDDIRVDVNDPSEVEFLHRQFPDKTHEEIVKAIREAGPMRVNIVAYLQRK